MTPWTIQDHIDQLMRNDKSQDIWVVIFYDPDYGHARECYFPNKNHAYDYYRDKVNEGRRPRMFRQTTIIVTNEILDIK